MDLTHGQTGRTIPLVVDNVVYRQDGWLLVEAMFSGLADLGERKGDAAQFPENILTMSRVPFVVATG